jgi:hypothetical protein
MSTDDFVDSFALPPVACTKKTLYGGSHGVLPAAKEEALFLQPFLVLSWPGRIILLHPHAPLPSPGLLENAVCAGRWHSMAVSAGAYTKASQWCKDELFCWLRDG